MVYRFDVRSRQGSIMSFLLSTLLCFVQPPAGQAATPEPATFLPLSQGEAWKKLHLNRPALPGWALILADSLPQTTGLMLELDALHRQHNPLGRELAAKVRWLVAEDNQCLYARAYALFDLYGSTTKDNLTELPPQPIVVFTRKLTNAAYTISDEEVSELCLLIGPEKVTALVHTIAFANFQQRLFHGLGVKVEAGGPLPPLVDVKFDKQDRSANAPPRPDWKKVVVQDAIPTQTLWEDISYSELRSSMDRQKTLKSRIPLPDWSRVQLPPDVKQRSGRIVWSVVSLGYQPAMTAAWFEMMNSFHREAKLDRVFTASMFWVITRTNTCFY